MPRLLQAEDDAASRSEEGVVRVTEKEDTVGKQKAGIVTGPGGESIEQMAPAFEFNKAIQLWVARPKMGKTSTAAALGTVAKKYGIGDEVNPFFMLFEPGSQGVELTGTQEKCSCKGKKGCPECAGTGTKRKILTTVEDVDTWFKWGAQSSFNPIVIDTGDGMFQTLCDAVCVKLGIRNPHESDHGVAWTEIYDTLREKLSILTGAGKGVIMLMHVYQQERRVRGGTVSTASFNVAGKSRPYIAGLADQILYFDVQPDGDGEKHVAIAEARSGVEAGDRWGVFPKELDLGSSAEEGAKAILGCFYDLK
jgi:hypothetical protein